MTIMEEAKYDYLYGEVNDDLNETKRKKNRSTGSPNTFRARGKSVYLLTHGLNVMHASVEYSPSL